MRIFTSSVFTLLTICFILFVSCSSQHTLTSKSEPPKTHVILPPDFSSYVCYQALSPLNIDGHMDEESWEKAAWSDEFVDIEGDRKPAPRFSTRVKMLWDEDYFYCAAQMEEPHVWATLTQRDAIIFYDHDFEVFIDPDGDTHEYYELEVNALNTPWDLFLVKPYRDGGPALHSWDIQGLKTGVSIQGTLNNPTDQDTGWTIEIAIPWAVMRECAHKASPPEAGDQWRVNFSRVEWQVEVQDGKYQKILNPETENPWPEDNWVWTQQDRINMHYPEMWGFVQFEATPVGESEIAIEWHREDYVKLLLRLIYYAQNGYFEQHGFYADNYDELQIGEILAKDYSWPPQLFVTPQFWEAVVRHRTDDFSLHINQEGRVWQE